MTKDERRSLTTLAALKLAELEAAASKRGTTDNTVEAIRDLLTKIGQENP